METKNRRLIVVLGMHRSGTSALTRGLKVMGVQLGNHLIPAIKGDNDKGFWEDIEINTLDGEMLAAINSDWFHLAAIGPTEIEALKKKGYFLRAVELLRKKTGNFPVFGFKDPRVSKLLPFWKHVFNHLQFDVSYVLVIRHPISVAKSLAKRNDLAEEQSHLLWLGHIISSLAGNIGKNLVIVDYDQLMKSPEAELIRIANYFDLEIDPEELQSYTDKFLDQGLRHTTYAPNDLLIDDKCPPVVQEIYSALLDVATEKVKLNDAELRNKITTWSAEFDRLKSPLLLIDDFYTKKISTSAALVEREDQVENLNQALAEHSKKITDLHHALAERERKNTGLHQVLAERERKNTDLYQTLAERDGKIEGLYHTLAERDEKIKSLYHTLAERDGEVAYFSQGLCRICEELGLNANSSSWVIIKPLKFYYQSLIYRPSLFIRRGLSKILHWFWLHLPRPIQTKKYFKRFLLSQFPSVFSRTNISAATNEYVPLFKGKPLENKPAKLICFYLPQFHAIPENDEWWGKGFTEWTSVQPAQPQFIDHYQPHIPDDLGYYNLLDPAILGRQVELAKLYGIEGFCFYFYWFGGKTLLEKPIENYLDNKALDLPFCLCWANESWSRTWDGKENDILIAQQHSKDDDLAFIQHVSVYMRDHRYIRIDGKPLLLVYRPGLLPSAKKTAGRWRKWCRINGLGEIYLAYTQSFDMVNPSEYDFDAAIEFPPNNTAPPIITDSVAPLSNKFDCTIYDWRVFVERSEKYQKPGYKLFRSVCPSWDNTARRKNHSAVFLNSSPERYQYWLENAIIDTHLRFDNQEEQLIFVNAWNEWAEGAHLEPDLQYGYAWLQATSNALLQSYDKISSRKIIIVSHDAHPHGAQYLSLYLAKTLSSDFGFKVDLVLLGDGVLTSEYSKWATVHSLNGLDARGGDAHALAQKLASSGHKAAIVNTTVSGLFLDTLELAGLRCVALIHELSNVIETKNLQEHAASIASAASAVVFPVQQVAKSFNRIVHVPDEKLKIRHQGLYKRNAFLDNNEAARKRLRKSLQLDDTDKVVLGVGFLDHRKGIDLFVEAGIKIAEHDPNVFFVWVGHWDNQIRSIIMSRIDDTQLQDRFLFVGRKDDTDMYYAGADVYALTSREDPFPSVVMESLEVSVPVVGFKGAGGFDTLLEKGCGVLVKKEDTSTFADALLKLLKFPDEAQKLGKKGASIIEDSFSFRHYAYDLLDFANLPLKRVSVIVPNYNYAQHLEERLESIINQTYPIYEIIVLDDASTDNSIEVIQNCLANTHIDYRLIQNKNNSGSVFKQWQRGIQKARGDYIWICEADDYASAEFIERSIDLFNDNQVVISYTQSRQIDEDGRELSDTYLDYTDDICQQKWLQDHICEGNEELSNVQAIKNTIPNVSAVIFRKAALKKAMQASKKNLFKLRIAGDWLIYANMLKQGKVGHIADSLNSHRRHQSSVTASSSSNARHLAEIIFMQEYVAKLSDPDEEIRNKANAYVKKIYKQFDLDHRFVHNPTQNNDVKQALDSIF